ncbi:glycine cleavage system protein GcvH [Leptospira sp. GIMC2001]|uniref:glycine cleavage system protein GcvH n=1 Tax=Leptospira sp. GIMC2001 TaxID=1513297 RepID=UPI00234BC7D6|nr:glycine cleavage system protein GcvH [Leptospira sp. GIMC2001]WCL49682.1 glycine cleavage system protein GcvH [Leptospira sp. GIMC2001]
MAETNAPQGYYFSEKHEWVKIEGNSATIGISDFAQLALGDIVYIDVPKVGKSVKQFESFGTIESVKAAEDLYSPITGEVSEVNPALESDPASINANPFEVWFIRVTGISDSELSKLMDASKYKEYVATLD